MSSRPPLSTSRLWFGCCRDATGCRRCCSRRCSRYARARTGILHAVFEGVTSERLGTALTRSCTAAGVPAFSPHDLRHRRVSLLHLGGMPWARIGELVGHDDLVTTARTYTHVVVDERELDYGELLV
jgi:integrase